MLGLFLGERITINKNRLLYLWECKDYLSFSYIISCLSACKPIYCYQQNHHTLGNQNSSKDAGSLPTWPLPSTGYNTITGLAVIHLATIILIVKHVAVHRFVHGSAIVRVWQLAVFWSGSVPLHLLMVVHLWRVRLVIHF